MASWHSRRAWYPSSNALMCRHGRGFIPRAVDRNSRRSLLVASGLVSLAEDFMSRRRPTLPSASRGVGLLQYYLPASAGARSKLGLVRANKKAAPLDKTPLKLYLYRYVCMCVPMHSTLHVYCKYFQSISSVSICLYLNDNLNIFLIFLS